MTQVGHFWEKAVVEGRRWSSSEIQAHLPLDHSPALEGTGCLGLPSCIHRRSINVTGYPLCARITLSNGRTDFERVEPGFALLLLVV